MPLVRGCLTVIMLAMMVILVVALFPLLEAGRDALNSTANITHYEGLWQFNVAGPWLVVGAVLLLAIVMAIGWPRIKEALFGRQGQGGA